MLASLRSRQMPARRVLAALVVALQYARGEWTGILGLNFESDGNKVDQRAMQCPSGFITGVTVRHGRDDDDDTDMYDFKLRCGDRWSAWSGMPFKSLKEEKSAECPMKMHVTGLEVKQVSTRRARGTHAAGTVPPARHARGPRCGPPQRLQRHSQRPHSTVCAGAARVWRRGHVRLQAAVLGRVAGVHGPLLLRREGQGREGVPGRYDGLRLALVPGLRQARRPRQLRVRAQLQGELSGGRRSARDAQRADARPLAERLRLVEARRGDLARRAGPGRARRGVQDEQLAGRRHLPAARVAPAGPGHEEDRRPPLLHGGPHAAARCGQQLEQDDRAEPLLHSHAAQPATQRTAAAGGARPRTRTRTRIQPQPRPRPCGCRCLYSYTH